MFARLALDLFGPYSLGPTEGTLDDLFMLNYGSRPYTNRSPANTSNIKPDSKKSKYFKVMLNVKHFSTGDIEVKVVDNFVVIHGKHEEKADQHGFVSREFTKRYQLPDDVDPETVQSSWRPDGVLTVHAPQNSVELPENERVVPITLAKPVAIENFEKRLEDVRKACAEYRPKYAKRKIQQLF
ncbi:Protein lethal(2)essential for life [Araneus ventricosus]|uniref:Protein lethal(2)essential for life n=1 Tax=Araneus ventricosus TaxID=182803 RepID=A0A4Y2UVP0_ARAVE|nr:Protein lethal(2)essential for life [Araneus ventricosus]